MALVKGVSLDNVFKLPSDMVGEFGRGPVPEESAASSFKVSSAGLVDLRGILLGPDGQAVKETWTSVALDPNSQLHLGSPSAEHEYLGDFIAFWITMLNMHSNGAYLGGAFLLIRQLGTWLRTSLALILDFREQDQHAELRGVCVLATRKQTKAVSLPIESGIKTKALREKAAVYGYMSKLPERVAKSGSMTKTFVVDGWRGKGEGMELTFCFSPDVGEGGWMPFSSAPALICTMFQAQS